MKTITDIFDYIITIVLLPIIIILVAICLISFFVTKIVSIPFIKMLIPTLERQEKKKSKLGMFINKINNTINNALSKIV